VSDPLSDRHLRPDPLHPTTWELIEIGALLICSTVAVWWVICAAADAVRFVVGMS